MNLHKISPFFLSLLAVLGVSLLPQALPAHLQGNPAADLAIYKSVAPLTALEPGDAIQYTLTFSNTGVLTATEVVISDTLPALLMDVIVTSTLPLTPTGNAWAVGILPPGAGGIISVTATVSPLLTSELPFTNTATITSPITDTEPTNNTSSVMSAVNLPPVVDAGSNALAIVGQPYTLTATFTDPGLDDTHTATIAWGDGLTGTAVLSETAHTLAAMHVYTATSTYTVTVGVRDNDGGQGEDSVVVKVDEEADAQYVQYLPILSNFLGNPLNTPLVSPAPNSVNEFQQGPISAQYGIRLLDTLVYTKSFVVHSMQTGIITGTFEHYLDFTSSTLKVTSAQPLQAGDTLQAILTTDLVGVMGFDVLHPDISVIWQFQTKTTDGSGYMVPASTLTFDGGESTDLAWGDVDRDGDGDVLITSLDTPATVWLNDGQGNFTLHSQNFGTGGEQAVALGDLDNDGDLDAVLATFGEESVWLNDRQGNYTPHPTMPTFGAGDSLDVALGDLNGDSFLDALVANTNGEPETVWLNDGTGAFSPHPTLPSFGDGDSTSVAVGDVDGDFDLDVVVTNDFGEPETVWLNDHTGVFSAHPTTPFFGDGNSQALGLGDLDNDGDVDAVIANHTGEPETVWMNDGQGNFTPHLVVPQFGAGDSTALALGDLEADGDLDLIIANDSGALETVWLNSGTGEMLAAPGTPEFGGGSSLAVILGDVEKDGDLDVLVTNADEPETLWLNKSTKLKVINTSPFGNGGMIAREGSILITFDSPVSASSINTTTFTVRGASTGTYPGLFSFPEPNQVQFTPAFPFFSGEDLVVTLSRMIYSEEGLPLRPYTFSLRAEASGGTGNLTLHPSGTFGSGGGWDVAPADLDGDRDLDAVINTYGGLAFIWMNDGSGALISHTITETLNVGAFGTALGDVDADGDLDAVFAGTDISTVWLNDGTGGFSPHPTFPNFGELSMYIDLQLADLDGDGDLDAVCANGAGEVWLNDGTGAFSPHPTAFIFGEGEISDHFFLSDIDQDGDQDVVVTMDYGATLWLNGGNGDFTRAPDQPDFSPLGLIAATLVLGDLDGDHDVDLLVGVWDLMDVSVWLNDGTGHFALHPTTPQISVTEIERMNLGDIDGDGDLDALFATPNFLNALWINDGLGNFSPHPDYPTFGTEGGYVVGVGDLDGDGDVDVILTGITNSSVYLNQNE